MQPEQITVEIRSAALGRVGIIDLDYVTDLKMVKRFRNVGSWTMSLPCEYDMAQQLAQPGRGIIVYGPVDAVGTIGVMFSGNVDSFTKEESSDDLDGTYHFVGNDDNIHFADGLAWPEPSNPDVTTQTESHDVRTGPAETLIRGYLGDNLVPGIAPAARAVTGLTLGAASAFQGSSVKMSARFDVMGQLLNDIAVAGGVGFELLQSGGSIALRVYTPEDKSDYVQMDLQNDLLTKTSYGFGAPKATRVIVAGQGEGVDRQFIYTTSVDAAAAETAWRRKVEVFKDRRDTDDPVELTQEGTSIIDENGKTITSLSVVPNDEETMQYGIDWRLGDIVSVVVDDTVLAAVVTEAVIAIDAEGVRTAATIGDPVGFDYESRLADRQSTQEKRLAALEKNEGVGVGAAPVGIVPVGGTIGWYGASDPPSPGGGVEFMIPDGRALSRTAYETLYDLIGTTHGAGDGSTTFNIPNEKGRVAVGRDSAQTEFDAMGETGGAKTHTLTTAQMPSHTHVQDPHSHLQNAHNHTQNSHTHPASSTGATEFLVVDAGGNVVANQTQRAFPAAGTAGYMVYVSAAGFNIGENPATADATAVNQSATAVNQSGTATNQNTGGGGAHNNLQPYIVRSSALRVK